MDFNLSGEEILGRLVALNAERAAEERRGPGALAAAGLSAREGGCFGASAAGQEQLEAPLIAVDGKEHKPIFPAGVVERTAARVRGAQRRARARSTRQPSRVPSVRALKLSLPIARVLASLARASPVLATFTLPTAGIMRFAAGRDPLFPAWTVRWRRRLESRKPDALSINSEFPSIGAGSVLGSQIEAGRLCAAAGETQEI